MSTQRRVRDAQENPSKTSEDRSDTRYTSTAAGASTRPTATSKESDSETEQAAGASPEEVVVKETTKVAAKVAAKSFSQCPRCHERRYAAEQCGETVQCINCRASVVLR